MVGTVAMRYCANDTVEFFYKWPSLIPFEKAFLVHCCIREAPEGVFTIGNEMAGSNHLVVILDDNIAERTLGFASQY
jgi:hypothetical protein